MLFIWFVCYFSLLSFLSFCFSSVSNFLSPTPSCPFSHLLPLHWNQFSHSILSLFPFLGLLVVVGLGSNRIYVGLMCALMVRSNLWWFDMCLSGASWVWLIFIFVFLFPIDGGDADVGLGLWFGCAFLWLGVVILGGGDSCNGCCGCFSFLSFCFSPVSNFLSPTPSCPASPVLPLNWNQLSHFILFHSPLSGWLVAVGLGFDQIYSGPIIFMVVWYVLQWGFVVRLIFVFVFVFPNDGGDAVVGLWFGNWEL